MCVCVWACVCGSVVHVDLCVLVCAVVCVFVGLCAFVCMCVRTPVCAFMPGSVCVCGVYVAVCRCVFINKYTCSMKLTNAILLEVFLSIFKLYVWILSGMSMNYY